MAVQLKKRHLGTHTCGLDGCEYKSEVIAVSDGFAVSYDGELYSCTRLKCVGYGQWFCLGRDENGKAVDHYRQHENKHHRGRCKTKVDGERCLETETVGISKGNNGYIAGTVMRTGRCIEHTPESVYTL